MATEARDAARSKAGNETWLLQIKLTVQFSGRKKGNRRLIGRDL